MLLDSALGGAANQSLAEASLDPGRSTQRHYHARSEEIYVFLEGGGEMEVEGDSREVGAGDAVLIPAGAWHGIIAGPRAPASSAAARRRTRMTTRFSLSYR